MRSATAAVSAPLERSMAQAEPRVQFSERDEALLRIDLSDLVLPQVNNLHVDGLKSSWLSRLFSRH
jgi:hypothetical protein